MSNATPQLKRHNHRVHPCKNEKKEELLKQLLEKNASKKIIVVTAEKSELTTEQENVSIVSDKELYNSPELRCEVLISYDLPAKAIIYMSRITKSETYALILLDPSEESLLHPIETLNGRTIMQELIEGFSEIPEVKQAQPQKLEKNQEPRKPRENSKDFKPWEGKSKPRENSKDFKPWEGKSKPKENSKDFKPWEGKSDKPRGDKKPWDKKEKEESRYIGKDENGKSIFSAKSGERNHHYDGTPKGKDPKLTGKKINIKTLKKKEDS